MYVVLNVRTGFISTMHGGAQVMTWKDANTHWGHMQEISPEPHNWIISQCVARIPDAIDALTRSN